MNPVIPILAVLIILFILWLFWGGGEYEYIGLKPLTPNSRKDYLYTNVKELNEEFEDQYFCRAPNSGIKEGDKNVASLPSSSVCQAGPPEEEGNVDPVLPHTPFSYAPESSPEYPTPLDTLLAPSLVTVRPSPQLIIEEEGNVCVSPDSRIDRTPRLPPRFSIAPPVQEGTKVKEGRGGRESRGQKQTCEALEKIYGQKFARNVRPSFLRNPETGSNLEYDCYNRELQIAAEYNGPQHYKWPNYLGSRQTYDQFIQQVRRDQLKVKLSDANGIYLITVPYNVPLDQIESYVRYYLPHEVQKRIQMGQETQ